MPKNFRFFCMAMYLVKVVILDLIIILAANFLMEWVDYAVKIGCSPRNLPRILVFISLHLAGLYPGWTISLHSKVFTFLHCINPHLTGCNQHSLLKFRTLLVYAHLTPIFFGNCLPNCLVTHIKILTLLNLVCGVSFP